MIAQDKAEQIYTLLDQKYPNPQTELTYDDAFTLTIAVLLSAQSTDKQVNKATYILFQQAKTPYEILALGLSKLENLVKTIGLYKTKSKNIILLCERLIQHFNGNIPDNMEDLTSLPGIGRKSANIILNSIFNQSTIAVDTHVNRLSKRLGFADEKDNILTVEKKLEQHTPNKWKKNAHHYLVLHGRYICKARAPQCNLCPLQNICPSFDNNTKKYIQK